MVKIPYMLDTNTCIHLIKYRPEALSAHMANLSIDEVAISAVVVAELWYGIALSQKKKHNEAALKDFLDYVHVLDWPNDAAPVYGRIRAQLKIEGTPIGAMDLLIAAHALFLEAILVTDNIREFKRVPDLRIKNWLE